MRLVLRDGEAMRFAAIMLILGVGLVTGCDKAPTEAPPPGSDKSADDGAKAASSETPSSPESKTSGPEAGPSPEAVPSKETAATSPGLAATVESIHRPDVRQVAQRLTKVLPVERLAADRWPETVTPWGPPPCPLGYQFQADLDMALLDAPVAAAGMGGQGLRIAGGVTMSAGEGGLTLIRNTELELSHVMGGIKRPGGKQPAESLAEVRLRRDGAGWIEIDGPTALWSAYGSFPGVVELWPALPSATAPGSRVPWALTIHNKGDGMKAEVTRGTLEVPEGAAFPTPSPHTLDASVELQGWLEVKGQPAMVLVSQWRHDDSTTMDEQVDAAPSDIPDVDMDYDIEARSRYVVLASGRLLWAEVHRITHLTMKMDRHSMKQRHDLRVSARLTSACDGPVLAEPPAEPTFEEVALEAFATLRNAAHDGDAEGMLRHLAPEVKKAHGEDAIVELLRSHVERLTALSLGAVELAWDVRRDGDRVRVHMTGSARRSADSTTTVHTVVEVESRDGTPAIVRIGTDRIERDEGWSILEISASRLFSGPVE